VKAFLINSVIAQTLVLLQARAVLDWGQAFREDAICLVVWDIMLIATWLIIGSKVRQIKLLKFFFSVWGAWIVPIFFDVVLALISNARAGAYW
jgi:hypothetical protein